MPSPLTATVTKGDNYILSSSRPTLTGYTFQHWATNAAGTGTTYNPGATFAGVASDVTFYAIWSPIQYTITYAPGDAGTNATGMPSNATVNYGASHTVSTATPSWTGHTFDGWYDGTTKVTGSFTVTGNRTLTAHWTTNTYTITYNANRPSDAPTSSVAPTINPTTGVAHGSTATLPQPTMANYTFAGWATSATGAVAYTTSYANVTSNVTLYAKWNPIQYTVTYAPGATSGVTGMPNPLTYTVNSGKTHTVLGTPSRTDYTFGGWTNSAGGAAAVGSNITVTGNVTLTAIWTRGQFTVTYNLNGGTGSPNPLTYTVNSGDTHTVLGTPTRTDYTFGGWTNSAGGTSKVGDSITVRSNITLTAIWNRIQYTVTYDKNGGTGNPATTTYTVNSGDTHTVLGTPTRTGYTFGGWTNSAGGTASVGSSITVRSNITLTAIWNVNKYTISYSAGSATGVSNLPAAQTNIDYNTSTTVSTQIPTRTGYSFTGWSDGTKTYAAGAAIGPVTGNITLTAQWDGWPTVTYNGNGSTGGTVPNGGSATGVAPGSTHNILAGVPTRSGYTFGGWTMTQNPTGTVTKYSNSASISGTSASFTMPSTSVTLYALWNPNIAYNLNRPGDSPATIKDVTGLGPNTVVYGGSINLPASSSSPSVVGYRFNGWKANNTGAALAAGAAVNNITTTTTFYADWVEDNGYTVQLFDQMSTSGPGAVSATLPSTGSYTWKQAVALLTAPVHARTGYTFNGWTLTYSGDNGTGTVYTGSTNAFNALWNAAKSAGQFTDNANKVVKLYANFTIMTRPVVTLNGNGGTFTDQGNATTYTNKVQILNGGNYTLPSNSSATEKLANPHRNYYNFKGWAESATATTAQYQPGDTLTNLTSNKTLYAVWEGIEVTFKFNKGSNGSTINGTVADLVGKYGSTVTMPNGYTSDGFTFNGWKDTGSTKTAGAGSSQNVADFHITTTGDSGLGTMKGEVVLEAQWGALSYSIAWNTQGGSAIANTTGLQATTTVNLPTPTRSGYKFLGWYTTATAGNKIAGSDTLANLTSGVGITLGNQYQNTPSFTFYAHWTENKVAMTFTQDNCTLAYNDNNALTSGATLYVGAATGKVYASDSDTAAETGRTIADGVKPVFATGSNYEFNTAHGSKWSLGSKTGSALSGVSAAGLLTVPKTGGLYTAGNYYITTSPKWFNYTVEYYLQDLDNESNYTKATTNPTGGSALSGTTYFGNVVDASTAATTGSADGTASPVIVARGTYTGFTYNATKSGATNKITMTNNAANNVIKLYFDRNTYTVNVTYTGDYPTGATYNPASKTYKYGETVTLIAPSSTSSNTFSGFRVAAGSPATPTITSNSFTMPAGNVNIEGVWGKVAYKLGFLPDSRPDFSSTLSSNATLSLDYGSSLTSSQIPTVTVASGYYFLGWEVYENLSNVSSPATSGNISGATSTRFMTTADLVSSYTITSNTILMARVGKTHVVTYTTGAQGAFKGNSGTVTNGIATTNNGTRYSGLNQDAPLPGFGGSANFEAAGATRNTNQPLATPGYKFLGWTWTVDGATKTAYGSYNASKTFVFDHGDAMPTISDTDYEFRAVWAPVDIMLIFDPSVANKAELGMTTLNGDTKASETHHVGDVVTLPNSTNYHVAGNASAYRLLGWTTDPTATTANVPFTTSFTMTAGTYDLKYVDGEGHYGITLYPIFAQNSVSIGYAVASGSTSMGVLDRTDEGNSFSMTTGTPQGSTPTANTGYRFVKWIDADGNEVPSTWVDASTHKITPQKGSNGLFAAGTYYVVFEAIPYTITFNQGTHGTLTPNPTTATVDYDSKIGDNVAGDPTPAAGYKFTGWSDGTTTYTAAQVANITVKGNMSFTAVYDVLDGYVLAYNSNAAGVANPSNQTMKWTDTITTIMANTAKNITRQGYTFGGWYATKAAADAGDASKIIFDPANPTANTDTFPQGLVKAGMTADGSPATLTLYARWIERTITVNYEGHWPDGSTTTIPSRTIKWTETGVLPTGQETLSLSGYTFKNWNSVADGADNTAVSNTMALSALYQRLFGNTDNTHDTITLHGVWQTDKYTVRYVDTDGNDVHAPLTNLTWEDVVGYYDYTCEDANLLGWKYVDTDGTEHTWTKGSPVNLPVSAFGGITAPTPGSTFRLITVLEPKATFTIVFNKVNVKDPNAGTYDESSIQTMNTIRGYVDPGTAIDITNFNTHNYITEFAAGRSDLLGYVYTIMNWPAGTTAADTKTTSTAAEAVSGGNIRFVVYWAEKIYTVTYDVDPAPSSVKPADKKVTWTSTDILPDGTVSWSGYHPPVWQYDNAAGTRVNVPGGATFATIANGKDDVSVITLHAEWVASTITITWVVGNGGSASSTDTPSSITIVGGTDKYTASETIEAATGTPHTMTAVADATHTFDGWYRNGVRVSTDPTFTPTKDGEIFTNATYEARFTEKGLVKLTIEHWFEQLTGGYAQDGTLAANDIRTGILEGTTINLTDDMIKSIKGFHFNIDAEGTIATVLVTVDGENKLKLYYDRNLHDVDVVVAETGADAPATLPVPVFTTTIPAAHSSQPYGKVLTLPAVTAPDGWTFYWTVSYTEDGTTNTVTNNYMNGETITMPNGNVMIVGTWGRGDHNVVFRSVAPAGMGGTVTANSPYKFPFIVEHGKTLLDRNSSGSTRNLTITPDALYDFSGWSYLDADGVTILTTNDPDNLVIDRDITFTAIWSRVFYVVYSPDAVANGNHGGSGFTSQVTGIDRVSDGRTVDNFPLTIGGADVTSNAPAAAGYRFVGWTWKDEHGADKYWLAVNDYAGTMPSGTAATMDFPVNFNVTFKAIWEALEQTVTYKVNGGNWTAAGIPGAAGLTTEDYVVTPNPRTDEQITLLNGRNLERTGYAFVGWQVWNDRNGNGTIDAGELANAVNGQYTVPSHNITFVAQWTFDGVEILYVIAKDADETTPRGTLSRGSEAIDDPGKAVALGSVATAAPGYKFVGWYKDADCTIELTDEEKVAWVHDSVVNGVIQSSRLAVTRPADGWLPVTYYAKFAPAMSNYKITYMLQTADADIYDKKTVTFNDIESESEANVMDPNNAAHSHLLDTTAGEYYGYEFVTGHDGERLQAIVLSSGGTELIVYYNRIPFDITYDLNGGDWADASTTGPANAIWGTSVRVPAASKDGSTHTGWTVTWTDVDGVDHTTTISAGAPRFEMPKAPVTVTANYAKLFTYSILVYKLTYDENGQLVTTVEAIPTTWDNEYVGVDGQVITIKPGVVADGKSWVSMMVNGREFDRLQMPASPGWAYDASKCDPFGIYSTDGFAEGDDIVLKIYYAPKSYTVNYVLEQNGSSRAVGHRSDLMWTTNDLAMKGSISGLTGYTLDGYGWQYKGSDGVLHDVDASMTYGDIVKLIYMIERDIPSITLYAKVKALNYTVIYVDDTNGADDEALEIYTNNRYGWNSRVDMSDPATLAGYNKPGYKWMGWEVRPAGATSTRYNPGAVVDFKTLASLLGISDRDDNSTNTPVTLYALWIKWAPVTIEFYTDDEGVQNKLDGTVRFDVKDEVVYVGGTYTVPSTIANAHRPKGYTVPSVMPSIVAIDGENVVKVIYKAITDFKMNLSTNYGQNTLAQIVTGLRWNEKPDPKATATPKRIGYNLKAKPQRWNTKADGTGMSFGADVTYAQLAAAIFGANVDDREVLKSGITLYAQWELANDYEVIYNLNNDPANNVNILTTVPDYRTPIDLSVLNESGLLWTSGGFDKSNDEELDAAPNGYEFDGWNTKADGTGLKITDSMTFQTIAQYIDPRHELKQITLYAQWKEIEIEITYTVNDESMGSIDRFVDKISAVTMQPVGDGSSAGTQLHSVATAKPGYHFVEWVKVTDEVRAQMIAQATGNTYENVLKMLRDDKSEISIDKHANDGRLYSASYMAKFERNANATVKYDANGGEGSIDPFTTSYGLSFSLDDGANFSKKHHTLRSWNTKPDGTGITYSLGQRDLIMPEEGMTLYAMYDINSYPVTVNPPKDGGSVQINDTDVVWGEKIPQSFIDSLNPWADKGWSFSGWEYTMTDADTGEVITGFTTDLSTLTVTGPLSLTPVFDGAYIVDGPPRTGDDATNVIMMTLIICASVSMFLLIILAWKRRKEDEEEEQA